MSKTYRTPDTLHTREYDKFKVIGGNRSTNKRHIQNLVESYADNPDLIELKPVLVNENMDIIDGQNRIEAMRILNIEVPYQTVPGLTISAAQLMNATSLPWSLDDFAQSYAFEGNPHYQQFARYKAKYDLSTGTLLAYIAAGTDGRSNIRKRFRLGYFSFPADTFLVDASLRTLKRVQEATGIENDLYARALLRFMEDQTDFDADKLINGIKARGITRKPTIFEAAEELVAAYARG